VIELLHRLLLALFLNFVTLFTKLTLLFGGKNMLKKIDTLEQFEDLLKQEDKFFLLKHSLTCPISHAAYQEYETYAGGQQSIPTYYLAVQDARPLSSEVAEKFEIKHESPQALLIKNGEVIWNASHWKITNKSLTTASNENL
jgi:bacillithiol system protein YtxJ